MSGKEALTLRILGIKGQLTPISFPYLLLPVLPVRSIISAHYVGPVFELKFLSSFTAILSGPTQCGKTKFIFRVLEHLSRTQNEHVHAIFYRPEVAGTLKFLFA